MHRVGADGPAAMRTPPAEMAHFKWASSTIAICSAAGGNIWAPYYRELDGPQLQEAHALGLKVIVWTVNDDWRMVELIDLGVDGIITDYPDRLRAVMAEKGLPLPAATPPRKFGK